MLSLLLAEYGLSGRNLTCLVAGFLKHNFAMVKKPPVERADEIREQARVNVEKSQAAVRRAKELHDKVARTEDLLHKAEDTLHQIEASVAKLRKNQRKGAVEKV
jgi:hypothetical protein